ncbi:MAG: FxsA family protein [Pseudorhodobacter sp.]
MWLLVLFVTVPLIEIALFIQVGGWLTLWPTLGIVLLTGIVGTVLVRLQGLKVLEELRQQTQELRDPLSPLAHGAMILVAGILLLTPGFFTDAVGFLLLVPPLRQAVIRHVASRIRVVSPGGRAAPARDDGIIDGDWEDVTPPEHPAPRVSGQKPSGWREH